jgi:predicted outer membrane repeat protein
MIVLAGGDVWSVPALSTRRDPNNVATFLNSPLSPSFPSTGIKPFAEVPAEANLVYLKWHAPDNRGSPVTHFLIETERLNDIGESACYSIDEIRVEATIEEREIGTLSFINANGMIENTEIPYTVAHTQPVQEAMAIYPWETGATGFKSATPYKFRVRAVNSVGSGEWSDFFKWRTEDETLPKTILGSNECPDETAAKTIGCSSGNESTISSNATFNAFTTLATAMEWMAPGRVLPSYIKGCNLFDQAMGRGGQVLNLHPSHAHHIGPHERCFKSARAQLIGVGGSSQTTINCGGHRCFVSGFVEKTKQWMFASVIKGVTFVNGSSSTYGGFLYIYGFSETFGMQIEDVVFQGGHAAVMGGAVFLEHCYVDPNVLATGKIIISATFIDNHANKFGGAIAVLSSDAVVIDHSVFRGSSSLEEGGALVMGPLKKRQQGGPGTTSVAGSNVADWTCSIETCVCEKDDPLRLETDACPFVKVDEQFTEQRGAIVVNNTQFLHNQLESVAGGLGGVVFLEEADIVLDNASFKNNQVNQVLGLGGCLYARSSKTFIKNTQFFNNIAGGGGSLCAVASSLEVESSLFFNNTGMQVGGGAIQSFFSDVVLKHNTISNNLGKYGGGVYVGPSTSFVSTMNHWVQNSAKQFGGALHCEGAESANVGGDNFTQNAAGFGGAVSVIETSNVHVHSKTIFQKNSATHSEGGGGAIYIDLRESDVAVRWNLKPLITSCVFLNNEARGVGTGILWTACDRTMGDLSLLPLVTFQQTAGDSYNNSNLIASTSQKLKFVPANGTKHYERSASTFATPWSLQVLDFYDQLSVISSLEVTVRSVTKMNEDQCRPFHGVNYDSATKICHFQQFNPVTRAEKGLATFQSFKINALPTVLFQDVPIDVEFILNLDSRSNTWLNRLTTQLYIESCSPGEIINPTDRKCLRTKNGHFASTYNHNAWFMKDSPDAWLTSDATQWNTSCPVGTYGDGKRIPWKKWEKGKIK